MHKAAYDACGQFVAYYLSDFEQCRVLDVGSYDKNGSLRPLFQRQGWSYVGMDQREGPNVDDCSGDPARFPFPDATFDVVVSSSCFEHDPCFWVTFQEMVRVTKDKGFIYLCVPSAGPYHPHPFDCWRFMPDSFYGLEAWCPQAERIDQYSTTSVLWKDVVGIFKVHKGRGEKLEQTVVAAFAEISRKFVKQRNRASDINELLPFIYTFATKCEHLTEFGVREAVSTWALLHARPKAMRSYDIVDCPAVAEATTLANEAGIDFSFHVQDVVAGGFEIETTDLLFIDTKHNYKQLKRELAMHEGKVRKYILMHDTMTFRFKDEIADDKLTPHQGLWPAIEQFLSANPHWELKKEYHVNNGMTVLARMP